MKQRNKQKNKQKRIFLLTAMLMFAFAFFRFNTIDAQAASKYTIYVNRKTNLVNVTDSKTGKLVKAMYCSTGKNYRTISGTYNTTAKYKWRALIHGVYGQYSTRIHGPYLFHSVPYYSVNKSKVSTKEYNKLGLQASAGCIRLAVTDAKWIYDNCRIGTKVVIGESRTLKKPARPKVKVSTKRKAWWDPTDPDTRNPYRPKLTLKKKGKRTIAYGSTFDIKDVLKVSSPNDRYLFPAFYRKINMIKNCLSSKGNRSIFNLITHCYSPSGSRYTTSPLLPPDLLHRQTPYISIVLSTALHIS